MGLGIMRAFHDHKMRIVVLVKDLVILSHRGGPPPSQVEPGFRIEWIAIV